MFVSNVVKTINKEIKCSPKMGQSIRTTIGQELKLSHETVTQLKKQITEFESFAKQHLGISADYKPGTLLSRPFIKKYEWVAHKNTATLINDTFYDLKNAGYNLPNVVSNSTIFKLYEKFGLTKSDWKGMFSDSTIINKNNVFYNPKELHHILKNSSSEDIAHEVGHYLHFQKNPTIFKETNALTPTEKSIFKTELNQILKDRELESINAAFDYLSQDPKELVAFYFQKAVHGQKFSDAMTRIYEKYGGPEIKGTIELKKLPVSILA